MLAETEKMCIGASDIASLVVRSSDNVDILKFGKNGVYFAHIIHDDTKVPAWYELVYAGMRWVKIYDDDGLTFDATGERFWIYRYGDVGCLIKMQNGFLNK